jgi:hypothetical protein
MPTATNGSLADIRSDPGAILRDWLLAIWPLISSRAQQPPVVLVDLWRRVRLYTRASIGGAGDWP